MTTLASPLPIASAYFVLFGRYGEVSRYAQTRGVSRQWIYREAHSLHTAWRDQQQHIDDLQAQLASLQQHNADLQQRLARAVVLDDDKQAEFASVGQAWGVSLPLSWALLDVLIPGQGLSVATWADAPKRPALAVVRCWRRSMSSPRHGSAMVPPMRFTSRARCG